MEHEKEEMLRRSLGLGKKLRRSLDSQGVPVWVIVRPAEIAKAELTSLKCTPLNEGQVHKKDKKDKADKKDKKDKNNNKKHKADKKDKNDKKDENDEKDTRPDSPDADSPDPVALPLVDDELWMIYRGKLLPPVPRFFNLT